MNAKILGTTILIILVYCDVLPFRAAANGAIWTNKWLTWTNWGPYWSGRDNHLRLGFYDYSCPRAEHTIKNVVINAISKDPSVPAALLRLYFHDCFVKGCDASILLDYTPSGEPTEKTSPGNLGVRGFDLIDEIKTRLEAICPGIVSCADIISFATRDAVAHFGVPRYQVVAGRHDGLSSVAKNILGNLPLPDSNVEEMEKIFDKKGLSKRDLVALLGAHSIGVAHCVTVQKQFNNYSSTNDYNPSLDKSYAKQLKKSCPSQTKSIDDVLPLNDVEDDQNRLSNVYYSNVLRGKAVIPADLTLLGDRDTNFLLHMYASGWLGWVRDFRDSMIRLGKVDVLTGEIGEIRRSCRVVNS